MNRLDAISVCPDLGLIAELVETLDRDASQHTARRLLAEHYIAVGWLDSASDHLSVLLASAPNDPEVLRLQVLCRPPPPPAPAPPLPSRPPVLKDTATCLHDFQALQGAARLLARRAAVLMQLGGAPPANLAWVRTLSGEQAPLNEAQLRQRLPALADGKAVDLLVDHLAVRVGAVTDADAARDAALSLARALLAPLPVARHALAEVAIMHMDHEIFGRIYKVEGDVIRETVCAEPVARIPRARFWVTEDGYPWDMQELVQALQAGGLSFRNPMRGTPFTARDVQAILAHPLGACLLQAQADQKELRRGLAPATLVALRELVDVMAADMSQDFAASFAGLDQFTLYVARLSSKEQQALQDLHIHVKDSHTQQPYQGTIGAVLQDARANQLCVHKAADFLGQALSQLSRGE